MTLSALVFYLHVVFVAVTAEVIVYNNHIVFPDRPEFLVVPKYAKNDIISMAPGKGRSYIDFSRLRVKTSCNADGTHKFPPAAKGEDDECRDTLFEMLMFSAPKDMPWFDYWENEEFCCTQELVEDGKCSTKNTLIIPTEMQGALVRRVNVKVNGESDSAVDMEINHHDIQDSGLYVLFMALCEPDASPVLLDGSVDSLDPYGYVPADLFGDLPFYLTLACMYSIVAAAWLLLCYCFRDQLMPLQMWITLVLAIGMIETTMLFAHYLNWNDSGTPATAITVIGLFFGTAKRALSRILVQLVSLGYGVVRPSLGEDMNRVLYLGGAYFFFSLVYTLMVKMPSANRLAGDPVYNLVSIIVLVLAMIDTTFYIWIFTSINSLLVSLASRKQGVKYVLYRNFRTVLFALLGFTCAWALYGTLIFMNDTSGANSNWREKWTVDALWELIYFVIMVAIAVMWAPSRNSQRYAYSIELSQLEDDDEWQEVVNADSALSLATGGDAGDAGLDGEYGGRLDDEKDPFQGTGALDSAMAMSKKA